MTNGPLSKSSTLSYIMRSKSKLSSEIRRERDSSSRNLITSLMRKNKESIRRRRKVKCMSSYKNNTLSY
jgi:hypothetical protein